MLSKIKSIKKIDKLETRYDIEVADNHCYFANEMLIHNCRCIAVKDNNEVSLWSRLGKPINTMPHIIDHLNNIMDNGEVWDGELYAHGIPFQEQISWFKKFSQENHTKVSYHVYDTINTDLHFIERWENLNRKVNPEQNAVLLVPTNMVREEKDITKAYNYYVDKGYEGVMIRHGDCKYTPNKRSRQLLKVKEFIDGEFEIVGGKENSGKMEGTITFLLKTKDGAVFECFPKGTDSERRQYFEDFKQGRLTGEMMTVRFFEWTTTVPPVPRFPIGICIRNYE